MHTLAQLGWSSFFDSQLDPANDAHCQPARVAVEHRGHYQLIDETGWSWATIAGRLRHGAASKLDLPAVGDWVLVRDSQILRVLERRTRFVREAAGRRSEPQVIAANIDVTFVVTSANLDFNPARLDRYVVAVWDSGAEPVIVLNKADLCDDTAALLRQLGPIAAGVDAIETSALTGAGLAPLRAHLGSGRTGALVGSSGVGKSTLVNALLGSSALAVEAIRDADDKGRHTTTRRELVALPDDGGLLIDTPGMRELALWAGADGAAHGSGFAAIDELAEQCRFRDCTHDDEPGCAVRDEVDPAHLASFHKLQRELAYQHRKQDALARQDELRRWKIIYKSARKLKED